MKTTNQERASQPDSSNTLITRLLGIAALSAFFIHCKQHLLQGPLASLLWLSNTATLTLALACFVHTRKLLPVATLWLLFCGVVWSIDVAIAGAPVDTAVATHVGSLVVALLATARVGATHGSWQWGALGFAAIIGISRLLPADANVNFAFAAPAPWNGSFSHHSVFIGLLLAISTLSLWLGEKLLIRCFPARASAALTLPR